MREKTVIYSRHALEQMNSRHISRSDVGTTLRDPDKASRQDSSRNIFVKLLVPRKLLVVVCEIKGERTTIITAFITSKVKKYL